jgi:hypothetical protein
MFLLTISIKEVSVTSAYQLPSIQFSELFSFEIQSQDICFFLRECYYSASSLSNAFRRMYVKDAVYIEKNTFVLLIWKKTVFRFLLIEDTITTDWTRLIGNCSMDFGSARSVLSLKLSNQRLIVCRRPYGASLISSRFHT